MAGAGLLCSGIRKPIRDWTGRRLFLQVVPSLARTNLLRGKLVTNQAGIVAKNVPFYLEIVCCITAMISILTLFIKSQIEISRSTGLTYSTGWTCSRKIIFCFFLFTFGFCFISTNTLEGCNHYFFQFSKCQDFKGTASATDPFINQAWRFRWWHIVSKLAYSIYDVEPIARLVKYVLCYLCWALA